MYENDIYSGEHTDEDRTGVYGTGTYNYSNYDVHRDGYGSGPNSDNDNKKKKKSHPVLKRVTAAVLTGVLVGVTAGGTMYGVYRATGMDEALAEKETTSTTAEISQADLREAIKDAGISLANTDTITYTAEDVSTVVDKVMPAMVSIVCNFTETANFFGQTFTQETSGSGSGIIVSENDTELLIATNYHVVGDANAITVTLTDGSEVSARIKGTDEDMDLAVIAVSKDDVEETTMKAITIATLGDSDALTLGEPVVAIGNALGYGQSVTSGIVSALDREIELENGSTGTFIQTDAAINPGNSGGALLNMDGEVVGINSNKIGGSNIDGMGYAIPITSASPIIAELLERQTRTEVAEADRGYMGISLQEITPTIAQMYNMPQGIYVVDVEEGSAADNAGIVKGDVITKFDGTKIDSNADLLNILTYYAAGETAPIVVQRFENGEYVQHELTITLGAKKAVAQ
ncbi:MAG: trypsin-like peptidase domain-containing protein [Acetatifactor sp.]|nr:trypsin-like peptidase domain-containing protein [Acetatifactor sp.]